ncbi:MAG: DUF2461 domain-containing protein [Xanthomonadales bacterium]|jgi:uncharacterized protein (TIGR02453 family)|nr:DUF2461 domain-containing protein [Xanthomonadales bacterium]MDH3941833.1 DUF2461 domain-containing protein [Xanthomonadales bacterium]MDH4000055.1 DUF2461 domain-containing protein [Xanthomonadales bacterium]
MTEFRGFPKDFFAFFEDLKINNNRVWFNENKGRYRQSVVDPISEFIVCMAPRLHKLSKHYIANPKPHGGSMFRIYRDTRFSKDKTPYKTHAGVQFRHEAGKDAHAPGFYLHLAGDGIFYGGGVWNPASPQLNRIRDFIADNARSWARIVNAPKVKALGGIRGDSLKRPPRGFDAQHVHIDDLKRKSFYIMTEVPADHALKPEFINEVTEGFRRALPLNRFITDALDLPF